MLHTVSRDVGREAERARRGHLFGASIAFGFALREIIFSLPTPNLCAR